MVRPRGPCTLPARFSLARTSSDRPEFSRGSSARPCGCADLAGASSTVTGGPASLSGVLRTCRSRTPKRKPAGSAIWRHDPGSHGAPHRPKLRRDLPLPDTPSPRWRRSSWNDTSSRIASDSSMRSGCGTETLCERDAIGTREHRPARGHRPMGRHRVDRCVPIQANRAATLRSQMFRCGIQRRLAEPNPVHLLVRPGDREGPHERGCPRKF